MQTVYWFVDPEGSLGHTQADSLPITWLLTIPTGQITLRNPSSIHHVSTPQWYKLTTSNPVPIHIGFLTSGTTRCLLTPAQHHWTEALRPLDATHWLHHPPPTLFSTTPADASTTKPKVLTASTSTHCLH
ncbi:hypothetical protein B5M09_013943 [Aphanomyces astaci]|uniref:Uncharacterized protein n=1 Tax=Aphanomyces astaci TaxID=112090 RepID=A0A425CQH2_APHAT|nr:hypothetical protein B5M09_013943 [Aphanomyces astaci]